MRDCWYINEFMSESRYLPTHEELGILTVLKQQLLLNHVLAYETGTVCPVLIIHTVDGVP